MKYLIITNDNKPFYTDWFDYDNLYNPDVITCVFDLETHHHSFDGGKTWIETDSDTL